MTRLALSGGAYEARSVIASAQKCLNLYAETMPTGNQNTGATGMGEPAQFAYYPTPGLRKLSTLPQNGVRAIKQATTGGIYAVAGSGVYRIDPSTWAGTLLGSITSGHRTPVSMQDNGLQMAIVDGSPYGWSIDLTNDAFATITDPTGMFSGADVVQYLDTYLIFNKPKTPQFYSSDSLALTFDPLWFANKQSFSDLLVTLAVAKREIWLLGDRTSEVWYNSGKPDFTFEEQPGTFVDHGTCAKYSAAVYDNSVFWLSRDRQGRGFVIQGAGYQTKRISTHAIEQELAGYATLSDAIGFCYGLSGHAFYVLTFPKADRTWVYDIVTGLWHEWCWIDSNGDEHRHRANCCYPCNDTIVVGDWQNGNLYALDRDVYTDDGQPIKRVRAYHHIINDANRVFYRQFVADIDTGWAPQVPHLATVAGPGGFYPLPRIAGGGNQGIAYGISADGHVAVGWVSPPTDDSFQVACYWTDRTGPTLISNPDPVIGENAQAFGASTDGSTIAGVILTGGDNRIFVWPAAGGLQVFGLPDDYVTGNAIDDAGNRVIGSTHLGDISAHANIAACFWDIPGFARTDLGTIPGYDTSECLAISADGSVIVGKCWHSSDSGATPRAFRWSAATGMVDLGLFGGQPTAATGVSTDGSVVVGVWGPSYAPGVFRWTAATGMLDATPATSFFLNPVGNALSADGTTLLGATPGGALGNQVAYLAGGEVVTPPPVPLDPANPTVVQSTVGNAITANGQEMVGYTNPSGASGNIPWIYYIPQPSSAGAGIVEDNLINLEWSDDRGHSYGSPVSQSIGDRGAYITSLQWQRLGYARDRVFRISWSVPMPTALQGAFIDINTTAKT